MKTFIKITSVFVFIIMLSLTLGAVFSVNVSAASHAEAPHECQGYECSPFDHLIMHAYTVPDQILTIRPLMITEKFLNKITFFKTLAFSLDPPPPKNFLV